MLLRRITDRMVETGSSAASQAGKGLTEVGKGLTEVSKRGNEAARGAYGYAMNHPKATAAVVLGTGVAAALIWMLQRNGGYSAMRRKVLQRVRRTGTTRSRRRVAHAE
jgi:hypothetical protein